MRSPRARLEPVLGFFPFRSDLCASASPGRAWGPCTLAGKCRVGVGMGALTSSAWRVCPPWEDGWALVGTLKPQTPGLWGLDPTLVLSSCCVASGVLRRLSVPPPCL